jgi:phosphatidylglycerol---prolipoprotein diacylglyceryl transferase
MPLAVIQLAFDPVVRLGPLDIRWQTIGVTAALLVALAIAARRAPYLPPRTPADAEPANPDRQPLRLDDLAYLVLGSVPGAVIGGRLVHGVVYLEAYAGDPGRLLDAGLGSLSLTGAVLGGVLTAGYVARMLAAPVRRWADAAAVPLLVAIGLGKLAQLLGGSGQGLAWDGTWAVAFLGEGPWHSLSAATPSHPAQVYEGVWALLGVALVTRLARRSDRAAGGLFAAALAWFLFGRLIVGLTWRDDALLGPLNAEQLVAGVALATGALAWRRRQRASPP